MDVMTNGLAAGWYPHEDFPGSVRYWDGSEWTDKIAPATPAPQDVNIRQRNVTLREAVGIVVLIALVLLLVAVFVSANA